MQVTPSNGILLCLSVTQFAEPLIIRRPLLLPPPHPFSPRCTPFSSLPLNYWWPWIQTPISPSSLPDSKTVTLPCPRHAICMKERVLFYCTAVYVCVCVLQILSSLPLQHEKKIWLTLKVIISEFYFTFLKKSSERLWNPQKLLQTSVFAHETSPRLKEKKKKKLSLWQSRYFKKDYASALDRLTKWSSYGAKSCWNTLHYNKASLRHGCGDGELKTSKGKSVDSRGDWSLS